MSRLDQILHVRLTAEQLARLQEAADLCGLSVSGYARKAIANATNGATLHINLADRQQRTMLAALVSESLVCQLNGRLPEGSEVGGASSLGPSPRCRH
jgi:uncharacterized protein (DUF1778 family)